MFEIANQIIEEERIRELLKTENRPPTTKEKKFLARNERRSPTKEPMDARITEVISDDDTPGGPHFTRTRTSTRHRPNHFPAHPVPEIDENGRILANHISYKHPVPYIDENGMIVDSPPNQKNGYSNSP